MQHIFVELASAVVCFEHVIKAQLGKKAVKQDFCTQHSWDFLWTPLNVSVTPVEVGKGCSSHSVCLTCWARCTSVKSLSVVSGEKRWMGPLFLGQIFVSYFSLSFRNLRDFRAVGFQTALSGTAWFKNPCPVGNWAEENSWGACGEKQAFSRSTRRAVHLLHTP